MKIYIDTDTFHAAPALYADAEKTKRLPATIPVVEGWAQELSVGFLGANQPAEGATVRLVLAPPGSAVEVARSTDGVRSTDAAGNALYAVLLSIDTSAMRALLDAARAKTLPLVAGVLVTDADAGTRVEYQFRVSVSESVIGVWETPVSMSELNLALGETRAARDAAQRAQSGAETAQSAAEAAQAASEAARDAAKASETAAKASEGAASESAESAAASARDAAESASLAGSRANVAETEAESASQSANEAASSAASAKTSETNASASATAAKASETAAGTSATNAASSEAAAKDSADAALASQNAAATAEANAEASASSAASDAKIAADSASSASSSASAAKASEDSAAESAATAAAKAEEISASAETIASNSARLDALEARVAENETDLTTKAEAADLTAETQRATAKENELETAIGTKADAATTYTKAEIDGVDTGAEVMKRLAEDEKHLREYEEFAGIKLPPEFWEAYFESVKEWQKDPTATKNWDRSTCPYYEKPPTKPVIDINVENATQGLTSQIFNVNTNHPIYLPNVKSCVGMLYKVKFDQPIILPNAINLTNMNLNGGLFNRPIYLPNATNIQNIVSGSGYFNQKICAPKAENCSWMCYRCWKFNQPVELPSCTYAKDAFHSTSMSAKNIAVVLNSLKKNKSVITFTGSSGIKSTATEETFTVTDEDGTEYSLANCPTFNTDDEAQTLRKAYVLAIAKKGWTVEI